MREIARRMPTHPLWVGVLSALAMGVPVYAINAWGGDHVAGLLAGGKQAAYTLPAGAIFAWLTWRMFRLVAGWKYAGLLTWFVITAAIYACSFVLHVVIPWTAKAYWSLAPAIIITPFGVGLLLAGIKRKIGQEQ